MIYDTQMNIIRIYFIIKCRLKDVKKGRKGRGEGEEGEKVKVMIIMWLCGLWTYSCLSQSGNQQQFLQICFHLEVFIRLSAMVSTKKPHSSCWPSENPHKDKQLRS